MQLQNDMEFGEISLRSAIEWLSENQNFRRFVLGQIASQSTIATGVGSSGACEEKKSAYAQSVSQTGVKEARGYVQTLRCLNL